MLILFRQRRTSSFPTDSLCLTMCLGVNMRMRQKRITATDQLQMWLFGCFAAAVCFCWMSTSEKPLKQRKRHFIWHWHTAWISLWPIFKVRWQVSPEPHAPMLPISLLLNLTSMCWTNQNPGELTHINIFFLPQSDRPYFCFFHPLLPLELIPWLLNPDGVEKKKNKKKNKGIHPSPGKTWIHQAAKLSEGKEERK